MNKPLLGLFLITFFAAVRPPLNAQIPPSPTPIPRPKTAALPYFFLRVANLQPYGGTALEVKVLDRVVASRVFPGHIGFYAPVLLTGREIVLHNLKTHAEIARVTLSELGPKSFVTVVAVKDQDRIKAAFFVDKATAAPKSDPSIPTPTPLPPDPPRLRILSGCTTLGLNISLNQGPEWKNLTTPLLETLTTLPPSTNDVCVSYTGRYGENITINKGLNFSTQPHVTLFIGSDGPLRPLVSLQPDNYFPEDISEEDIQAQITPPPATPTP
jgi:hypothetical protein